MSTYSLTRHECCSTSLSFKHVVVVSYAQHVRKVREKEDYLTTCSEYVVHTLGTYSCYSYYDVLLIMALVGSYGLQHVYME